MKRWVALSVALTILAAAVSFWFYWFQYDNLPDRLPIHWNIYGQADGWVMKQNAFWAFFLMPTAMAGLVGLTLLLPWLSPRGFEVDRFRATYGYVMMLSILLLGYIHGVALYGSLHAGAIDIGRWLIGGIFIILGLMGNVLGKVRRNFYMGIRTPWTLASERVWNETHRLTAWLFVGGSLVALVALIAQVPLMAIFIAYISVIAVVPIGYSFILYKRLERQGKLGPAPNESAAAQQL